jgi:hypothetical protein
MPLYESAAALSQKTTIRLSLFQKVVYSDFTSLKETSGVKSCFVYFKGFLDSHSNKFKGYYFIYLA